MQEIINAALVLAATESIKEVTKNIISVYVKPKLESLYKETKEQNELDLIEYKFNAYLERSYEKYLYMNTIVFKNGQRTINDLYIPLKVKKSSLMNNERKVEICIDKYRDDFIPAYKKILLVDNAGMGKSTIMKYLYLSAVTEKKGIPILIELRKIDKDVTLVDFIMNEINGIKENFEKENILTLIERGDFIFLFDGYDEIKEEFKESVTKNLEDFIDKSPKNEFIISSREESSLSCFGDFQRFDINPLSKEEAYRLIKRYDKDGELSKQLIDMLENEENLKIVREFLDNPLMVSLLYLAFGYRRDLPNGKHIFYKQVYNALFLEHDKSKGGAYVHPKKSNLNIDEFHKILRILGFITLKEGVSYSREKLLEYLEIAKKKAFGVEFKESNFIHDLEYIVPLFVKEGNEYKWCHKSFQEYFAACYIYHDSKEKQKDILLKISANERIQKYYNVLDFYYDLDYKGFMEILICPVINYMEEFHNKSYKNIEFWNYDIKEINLRKANQFKYEKIIIKKFTDEEEKFIKENRKDRKFNKFEYLRLSVGADNLDITSYVHVVQAKIAIIYFRNRTSVLLEMISTKSNDIVTKMPDDYSSSCLSFMDKIDVGVYEINDRIDNILNEKGMFKFTNDFLCFAQPRRSLQNALFDYTKSIELKKKIINEIESVDDDIDYL